MAMSGEVVIELAIGIGIGMGAGKGKMSRVEEIENPGTMRLLLEQSRVSVGQMAGACGCLTEDGTRHLVQVDKGGAKAVMAEEASRVRWAGTRLHGAA
jgi:hypothetical protein